VTKTNAVAVSASFAALLFAALLLGALAVKPTVPTSVGFGIVALFAFGLGAVATRAPSRVRVPSDRCTAER